MSYQILLSFLFFRAIKKQMLGIMFDHSLQGIVLECQEEEFTELQLKVSWNPTVLALVIHTSDLKKTHKEKTVIKYGQRVSSSFLCRKMNPKYCNVVTDHDVAPHDFTPNFLKHQIANSNQTYLKNKHLNIRLRDNNYLKSQKPSLKKKKIWSVIGLF